MLESPPISVSIGCHRTRPRRRVLGIGSCVAGAVVFALATCGRPSPEPHIDLLKSQQRAVRERAAGKLMRYGDEIVPRLIQEVGSGYTTARFESVRLLGRLRDRRAVPILIHALNDRSANVAALAAWGLGEMRATEAVPALLPYTGEIARDLRAEVIRALGLCYKDTLPASTADSVHAAVLAAFDDDVPKVRIAALQSMHEFGFPNALDQVIRLSEDAEPEVRYVAVQALGQIGSGRVPRSPGAAQGVRRDLIIKALLKAIAETRQSIRTKAVRALEMMEAEQAIPTLRVLEHGTEEDRREARRVLENLGVPAPPQT
jgi:HEAT repeat protein